MASGLRLWLSFAAISVVGCGGVPAPATQRPPTAPGDEMPAQARKVMPRAELAMSRGIEDAAETYTGDSGRTWGQPAASDEALQKHLARAVVEHRVIEGWVARITYILQRSDEEKADEDPPVVRQLALQLPDKFLNRFSVYYRAENYDRQSGYFPVSDDEIKKFKPGDWVKFSGVLQSESLPHWNSQAEQGDNNFVWLGTITLTELDKITEKPK
ncbi:MAG TPA: hypothetical protein VGZ22_31870 [Isosphaeraceae bacterium]|jgi:hypothetical protein|nr:hypothetical protein [Isosphaeraceae bacterium]